MYVVSIEYTESDYPEYSIMGPYETFKQAKAEAIAFMDKMDDMTGDWSQVYQWEVRKVRDPETNAAYYRSWSQLWARLDAESRTLANLSCLDQATWT